MSRKFQSLEVAKTRISKGWNFWPAGLLLLVGCASLDEQVTHQSATTASAVGEMASRVSVEVERAVAPEPVAELPAVLNLTDALRLATLHNREVQAARESLYLDTLSLFGARRDYGVTVAGSVDYILNKDKDSTTGRSTVQLSAQRSLPTGGNVSLSGEASQSDQRPDGADNQTSYSSRGRLRVDQPLGAGAGYEASHASLIQAERDYVYALRDFVVQRQDQALQVMRQYFTVLQARRVQENNRLNVTQVQFLRQRSEALFKVSRAPAIDVLRSQQEELSAVNRWQAGAENYALQVRRFLVYLGLSATDTTEVQDEIPVVKSLAREEGAALAVALTRRLDVLNVIDRLSDAERALRVARNAHRVEVGVFGEAGLEGQDADTFSDQDYDSSQSAGVTLELPLDRRDERDAVKRAALALQAARRARQEKLDEVRLEIASAMSELRTQYTTVDLEARNIEVAEKRARNASLRFRNGELSNRDVIEAENDLLNARNAWGQARIDYELQRVQLLRHLGLLDVAEDGTLIELPFPEAAPPNPAPTVMNEVSE